VFCFSSFGFVLILPHLNLWCFKDLLWFFFFVVANWYPWNLWLLFWVCVFVPFQGLTFFKFAVVFCFSLDYNFAYTPILIFIKIHNIKFISSWSLVFWDLKCFVFLSNLWFYHIWIDDLLEICSKFLFSLWSLRFSWNLLCFISFLGIFVFSTWPRLIIFFKFVMY